MKFKVGDRVRHDVYGECVIIGIDTSYSLPYQIKPLHYEDARTQDEDLTLIETRPITVGDLVEFKDGTRGRVQMVVDELLWVGYNSNAWMQCVNAKDVTLVP